MVALLLIAASAVAWFFLPKPPLLDGINFSRRVFDRNGKLLYVALTDDDKYRIFTPLDEISPELIESTLAQEDRYFADHPGVNPVSLARATWHFCLGHAGRGGASTITMQLARLRFQIRSRTIAGKCSQMLRALELERHYSKTELLEAYLNLAPYGGNIEGAGAASEIYFGKSAGRITMHEAVALSVIPQSPSRRVLQPAVRNESLEAAQERLLRRMQGNENSIAATFVPLAIRRRPMLAPHFTTALLRESNEREIHSTLDLNLQRILERRIADYVRANAQRGIHNAAAMLVDTRTMDVLAQVGSADFTNAKIDGQVDATQSPRSPGSTLKPFVYALAMDQGLIHPLTMLKDAPRSFGAYNPENFDREFVGPIRACDALARSRNIPAVTLASQLTQPTLYNFLRDAGVHLPRAEKFYGLALPLGGAEVTMQDLVRLYSALANGGALQSLRRLRSEKAGSPPRQMFSREAAFLALEMLGQTPRPGVSETSEGDAIFWKTGTSHGFHDAWSVSVFDHFVLAVRVGNADGKSNPAFIGRSCAAPLLFQIIDNLRGTGVARPTRHEPPANANLREVEFCAVSGQLPTAACAHRVRGWFIPSVSPISACEIHREIWVDNASGLRVNHQADGGTAHRENAEFWPSDLLQLFAEAGLPRKLPPPFAPGESVEAIARSGRPPRITSPRSDVAYSSAGQGRADRALTLVAETDADVRTIYWFAGREFIGAAKRNAPLDWQPRPGKYTIVALDDHGRSDARNVACTE
ncbi:MAG: penicillin-binding protein 1C [Chthoniobacterales bacterium]